MEKLIELINLAYETRETENCHYQSLYKTNKELLSHYFKNNGNNHFFDDNNNELIKFRLYIINKLYSTRASDTTLNELSADIKSIRNLKKLFADFNPEKNKNCSATKLFEKKFTVNNEKRERKEISLISKYAYFLTDYSFPIYDSLMKETLSQNKFSQFFQNKYPSRLKKETNFCNYFQSLKKIISDLNHQKNKDLITFDKLDAFGWLIGKIDNNSTSYLQGMSKRNLEEIKNKWNNLGN